MPLTIVITGANRSFGFAMAKDFQAAQISVGIYHPGYVQTGMVNVAGQTSNSDISADVAASGNILEIQIKSKNRSI